MDMLGNFMQTKHLVCVLIHNKIKDEVDNVKLV